MKIRAQLWVGCGLHSGTGFPGTGPALHPPGIQPPDQHPIPLSPGRPDRGAGACGHPPPI